MLAMLGEITFEALSSPRTMSQSRHWKYAIQPVIEGRAKLQWVADGLSTMSLEMLFHRSFTDPASQTAKLLAAASDHQARPLIFGTGDLQGYFVITRVTTAYEHLSANGEILAIALRVELLQRELSDAITSQLAIPDFLPLAAMAAAPGNSTGAISVSPAANSASEILPMPNGYSQTRSVQEGLSLLLARVATVESSANGLIPADITPEQIVRAGF
jgi:phage protein U